MAGPSDLESIEQRQSMQLFVALKVIRYSCSGGYEVLDPLRFSSVKTGCLAKKGLSRERQTGDGAYFAFFLGSDTSHTTTPKIPSDEEGLLWGWCVVRGPLHFQKIGRSTAPLLKQAIAVTRRNPQINGCLCP